jgi:hypothetical protein
VRTMRRVLIQRMIILLLGTLAVTVGSPLLPITALATVAAIATACLLLCVRTEVLAKRRFIHELRDVQARDSLEIP